MTDRNQDWWHHLRGSVRRASGFVPTHKQEVEVIEGVPTQEWQFSIQTTKAECRSSTPLSIKKWIELACHGANLRLDCFLVSFCGKLLCHCFLDLLSVHSVAFGGVHENVVAASSESLIRRIQQEDFEKQLAEFGLIRNSR